MIEQTPLHALWSKVGMLFTGGGSATALVAAKAERIIDPEILGATVDEWKVYGVVSGILFAIIGVVIQTVTAVLSHRHRARMGRKATVGTPTQ